MLRTIRIILSVASIVAVTLLFLDFTGFAAAHWGWMARIQLIPAILSFSFLTVALIIVATLIFGRLYCSVVCPLGIFQDFIIWLRGKFGPHARNRFAYHSQYKRLRLSFFILFAVLIALGTVNVTAMAAAGLLEPYSEYGRMASTLLGPVYDWANNLLADYTASEDNYMFTHIARATQLPVLITAIVSLVVVSVFAWMGGRNYCNIVCPVGTFLGFISRFSLLKPVIDTDRCNGCKKCARNCKASCIDASAHTIDYSRCVVCMDCIGNCSQHAISYRIAPRGKKKSPDAISDTSRRSFLITAAAVTTALAANAKGDGTLAPVKQKESPVRLTPLVPPGARSIANLKSHCTACQLCIQSCPNNVLKPSTSLDSFMQPVMTYTEGYCRPECTRCSDVCPAGAILPLDEGEKSAVKIGTAVVDPKACISAAYGRNCGLCSRRCPVGAITMVETSAGHMRPVVNESACIGCGACEYNCPVGTVDSISANHSAIHVEGISVHKTI